MENQIIVVKPTNRCNLSCKYCYDQSKGHLEDMSIETLYNTTNKFGGYFKDRNLRFLWHGGEPLLVGRPFYEKALSFQRKFSDKVDIHNSIQTNLTCLTEDFADFIIENRFSLSFSLDGPILINNQTRVYEDGRGSYKEVEEGISILKKKGIKPRALLVLTKKNKESLPEIYNFFKDNNIPFKVHALVYSGRAKNQKDLSLSPKEHADSLVKLFDIWFNDNEFKIKVDPLYQFIGNLTTNTSIDCYLSENCQDNFISVASNGDVYPCWRFDGLTDFKYGNINRDSLDKILDSPVRRELLTRRSKNLEECCNCSFGNICNSGCMNNAYNNGDIMDKDIYCESYKKVYQHINSHLSKINKK